MSTGPVIAALLPVFLLIATGVLARRYLVPDDVHWLGIERLTYYLLFPALLIDTLSRADIARVPVAEVGGALLGAVLLMSLLCLALRPLLAKSLGVGGAAFTSIFQGSTRWQTFVALALGAALYGERGLALASVAAVAMIPILNVINVWVLAHFAAPVPPKWRSVAKTIVQNPLIWSCLVGIALNLAQAPIPASIHAYADSLGRASLALGLLLVGAGLKPRFAMPARAAWIAVVLKLAVMPAIAIALALAFGTTGGNLVVVACCAGVPAASTSYVLARQMGGDTELLAEILTLQTVLAVVTLPIAIELVSH